MSLPAFFDNFALLADARNSIAKMRELILQFALEGKLIPQSPSDKPSSDLLEKVAEERRTLLSEGKIRKLREIEVDFPPSIKNDIPSAWRVEWLGNLASAITKGATPTTYGHIFQSEGIRFIKVENVKNNRIVTENITDFISEEAHKSQARSQLEFGDVLFSIAGTIGESCIVKETDLPANTNQALAIIRGTKTVFLPDFLKLQLDSFVANAVRNKARGGAMNNVSLGDLKELLVHIPPFEEQKRIVAKVDELMRFCDELETRQKARRESRLRLNNVTLAPLNNGTSLAPEEFELASVRLADNFATLYDSAETVSKLRSTILQLAVQGKLVPQDPNDESASELYEHIQLEQAQQQSEDPYKISKPLPPISESDRRFPLPPGWEWFRLRALVFTLGDGLHGTPEYLEGTECYFINGNNLVGGQIVIKPHTKTVSLAEMQKHKKRMTLNTVLVSINGTLGSIGFYNNENVVLGKSACYFNLSSFVDKYFVRAVIESAYFVNYAMANATGTTIRNLGLRAMNYFPVPLPPLAEQRRIVAKINHLMALCDELEAKLRQAEADSEKLMNAAVQHVLASLSEPSMPALARVSA